MVLDRFWVNFIRGHFGLVCGLLLWLICLLPAYSHAQCDTLADVEELFQQAGTLIGSGKQKEALVVLDCAESIAQKQTEKSKRVVLLSKIEYRRGLTYDDIGYTRESLDAFLRCQSYLISLDSLDGKNKQRLSNVINAIAIKYSNLAEIGIAKSYMNQAIEKAVEFYGENDTSTSEIISNAASFFTSIEDYTLADSLGRRALKIARNTKKPSPNPLTHALINLSENFLAQEQVDSAFFYIGQALPYVAKLGKDYEMSIRTIHAKCQIHLGRVQEGLATLSALVAELAADTNPQPRSLGILRVTLADALHRQGRNTEALATLQVALHDFNHRFTQESPKLNPARPIWNSEPWVFEVLRRKSEYLEAMGDPKEALACDTLAFNYLDYLRKGFNTSGDRNFIASTTFVTYERAISLALTTHASTGDVTYLNMAFRFIEQSKINEILESLQEIEQGKALQLDPALLKLWRFQKTEIARLSEEVNVDEIALKELYQSQESLRKTFEQKYPMLAELLPNVLATPTSIQAKLQPGELLLEYFIGDSTLYVFAIDNEHFDCFQTPLGKKFERAMTLLMRSIGQHPTGKLGNEWRRFVPSARYLFAQLLGPVIGGNFRKHIPHSITIVPDGRLALLPFECLLTEEVAIDKPNFASAPYLLRLCAVRYGQSATTLLAQGHRNPEKDLKGVLAFSPNPDSLRQLKYAGEEVEVAKDRIKESRVLKGNDADKRTLFKFAPDYRIVHLACHAVADTLHPLQSWFALEKDDGSIDTLYAHEIFDLDLNAELVVLSACGTGKGKLLKGEGVMNLARSFQSGGCPTTVMSLWDLDDKTTANIVSRFYFHLSKGKSASRSLQYSRLEYLHSEDIEDNPIVAHPYYWAAMVAVGDDGPHLQQYDYTWRPLLIWGAIVALIIALLQRRARRKRAQARKRAA